MPTETCGLAKLMTTALAVPMPAAISTSSSEESPKITG